MEDYLQGLQVAKERRRRILKAPLIKTGSVKVANKHYAECEQTGIPYAVFTPGRKYGSYSCDLLHLRDYGLTLTEAGVQQVKGIFEATFARWRIDERLPRSKQEIMYSAGRYYISLSWCPIGEEDYIHQAICRVLSMELKSEVPDNEPCGPADQL